MEHVTVVTMVRFQRIVITEIGRPLVLVHLQFVQTPQFHQFQMEPFLLQEQLLVEVLSVVFVTQVMEVQFQHHVI